MHKSKIGTFEAIMVTLTLVTPYTVISLPRSFINKMKSGTILNIVFVTILGIMAVLFVCKMFKRFPGLDILDIADYLGGKVFKNIIGLVFIFYFLVSSAILLRTFCEGLLVVYYPLTNVLFLILLFITGLTIANNLNFSATLKASSLIVPLVLISILLLFFGNIKNFSPEKFFPIIGEGFKETFILGITNIGTFGGISYLYFLPPLLKNPDDFKKISVISILASRLFILVCVLTLLLMFSFYMTIEEIMPLFSAAKYIEFGTFFQRFESLFFLIWIIAFCCYLSIACKFSTLVFKKMLNLKDISQLNNCFSLLIFGIALLPKNYSSALFYETNIYKYLRLGIIFGLGFSILIFSNLKKRRELKY